MYEISCSDDHGLSLPDGLYRRVHERPVHYPDCAPDQPRLAGHDSGLGLVGTWNFKSGIAGGTNAFVNPSGAKITATFDS